MNIYINTAKQPPSLNASASVRTDAEGKLLVYASSVSGGISAFAFKRETTVTMNVYFPADADVGTVTKIRYGLKRKGRYDDVLVILAEADGPGEAQADGTVKFVLKPKFSAGLIDAALNVDSDTEDDIEKAEFISEIEWENADGEVAASETVSTVLHNNVVRRGVGGASADSIAAGWSALMVVRISWEDYCALEVKNPEILYVVADAPSEVDEHNEDPDAHPELVAFLTEQIAAAVAAENRTTALRFGTEDADGQFDSAAEINPNGNASFQDVATVNLSADSTETDVLDAGTVNAATLMLGEGADAYDVAAKIAELEETTIPTAQAAAVAEISANIQEAERRATEAAASELAAAVAELDATDAALADEIDALANTGTLTNAILVDATTGTAEKVLCPEIDSSDANVIIRGYYGTLANLGCTGENIVPKEITFYKRSYSATSGFNALYMRILRKDAEGRWTVAYESTNTIKENDYSEHDAMTFTLVNKDGKGAIPATEEIAIAQTPATTNAAESTQQWGAKKTSLIRGAILPGVDLEAGNTVMYAPALDVAYYAVTDLEGAIEDLQGALEGTQETLETLQATAAEHSTAIEEHGTAIEETQGTLGTLETKVNGAIVENIYGTVFKALENADGTPVGLGNIRSFLCMWLVGGGVLRFPDGTSDTDDYVATRSEIEALQATITDQAALIEALTARVAALEAVEKAEG